MPNYSKEQQKSEIVPLSQKMPGSSSNSVEDENEEDATILCSPRKLISYCDVELALFSVPNISYSSPFLNNPFCT